MRIHRSFVVGILICLLFQLRPVSVIADTGFYRSDAVVSTMGSYALDIPDQGIECTLTYERHDYTQYIGSYSVECPIMYDLPILSGNLPGIDKVNEMFRQDLQRFEDEIYGEYGLPMYIEYVDEDMYFIATNKVQTPVYGGEEERSTGLQYYDGRYLCLLFEEEMGDRERVWPTVDIMTFDLQTGEKLSFTDLFGNIANIRAKLETELEDYLRFWIQEDENIIRDITTQFKMVSLDELDYGISEDGMLFLYLRDDVLDCHDYSPMFLQTSISLSDALSATPKQEHDKKIARVKMEYDVGSNGRRLTERWDYDHEGNVVSDTEYNDRDEAFTTCYEYDGNGRMISKTWENPPYDERETREYSADGHWTKRSKYRDDYLREEYTYVLIGDINEIASEAFYEADGSGRIVSYTYDDHGNTIMTKYETHESDGSGSMSITSVDYQYEYDAHCNTIREYKDGVINHEWSYEYWDDTVLRTMYRYSFFDDGTSYMDQEYYYSADGTLETEQHYNKVPYEDKTYLSEYYDYYADGSKRTEIQYGSNGGINKEIQYDENGERIFEIESGYYYYWYEYNSEGLLGHVRMENSTFYNQEKDERFWDYGDTYYEYNYNGDLISKSTSTGSRTEYTYEYWGDDEEKDRNAAGIPIDEEHFPDEEFRYYIRYCGIDANEDGYLSDSEIAATDTIELVPNDNIIESLEGIEYFTALTNLDVCAKNIERLDVSMLPHLHRLACDNNGIHELILGDLSELVYLDCSYNQITTLDISGCEDLVWMAENGGRYQDDETIWCVVENRSPSPYGEELLKFDAGVRLITMPSPYETEEDKAPSLATKTMESDDYVSAYLTILRDYEYEIQQNENSSVSDGNGSVAIADFFGDATPELLFATYYEEWERPCTILHAYTMIDGEPKELDLTSAYYAPSFVSYGSSSEDGIIMWENMTVCLFTCEVDEKQCLAVYYNVGDDYLDELFTVFERTGDDLQIAHQYTHSENEWTDGYGYIDQVYVVDGAETDAYEYGNVTTTLMHNAEGIVYAGYVMDELGGARQNRLFVADAIEMLEEWDPDSMVVIDEAHFPDEAFRQALKQEDYDANGDGVLSGQEIQATNYLDVCYMGIESLEGIEYLSELETLACEGNSIRYLDVSMLKKLYGVYCSDNGMETLILGTAPDDGTFYLICSGNNLDSVDISGIPYLCDIVAHNGYYDDEYGQRIYESGDPDVPELYTIGHDSKTKMIFQGMDDTDYPSDDADTDGDKEEEALDYVMAEEDDVMLRLEPSSQAEIGEVVHYSELLPYVQTTLDEEDVTWYEVIYDGAHYWASGDEVELW